MNMINHKEPLIHITRRKEIEGYKKVLIKLAGCLIGILVSVMLASLLIYANPLTIISSLFSGVFGTGHRIRETIEQTLILMCISLCVALAGRMKFWNCGAEGQVLMGALGSEIFLLFLGGKVSTPVLYILMFVSSILFGIIWALIPALFKAKWNTNETLFTLMMNYVAMLFVSFFIIKFANSGSGTIKPDYVNSLNLSDLPKLIFESVICITVFALIYVYMKYTKHGYEVVVVGESQKTAKYIGLSTKKVIIRTMIISGCIAGIVGFILVGLKTFTINKNLVGGQGFTGILVAWLGKFEPLNILVVSFLVIFLKLGTTQVSTTFKISDSIAEIVTGLVILFIIGCEFFINYKVHFRKRGNK